MKFMWAWMKNRSVGSHQGMAIKRARKGSALSLECLESRDCPAGSVTASLDVVGRRLVLTGDSGANAIVVSSNSPGVWAVSGQAAFAGDSGTKINGAFQNATFSSVADISINMKGGNNTVRLSSAAADAYAIQSLSVLMGDGYDTLTVSGVKVAGPAAFSLAGGDDKFTLTQSIAKSMSVDMGSGDDDPVELYLLAGNMQNLEVRADGTSRGSQGRDNVIVSGQGDSTVIDKIAIRTGKQDDRVSVTGVKTRFLYSHGGSGRDRITLGRVSFFGEKRLELDGYETVN